MSKHLLLLTTVRRADHVCEASCKAQLWVRINTRNFTGWHALILSNMNPISSQTVHTFTLAIIPSNAFPMRVVSGRMMFFTDVVVCIRHSTARSSSLTAT